jgi:hypothetical protein
MRAWFMIGTLIVGLIGFWGQQGRTAKGGDGMVSAQDGPNPIPSPKAP